MAEKEPAEFAEVTKHSVLGYLDKLEADILHGWIYSPDSPAPLAFTIVSENYEVVAEGVADQFREDLLQAGIGSGHHGFSVVIAPGILEGAARTLRLQEKETGYLIPGAELDLDRATSGSISGGVVFEDDFEDDFAVENLEPGVHAVTSAFPISFAGEGDFDDEFSDFAPNLSEIRLADSAKENLQDFVAERDEASGDDAFAAGLRDQPNTTAVPEVPDSGPEQHYDGHIDRLEQGIVHGWLHSLGSAEALDFVLLDEDGQIVAEGRADQFRQDLLEAGIGEGKHSFAAPLVPRFFSGAKRSLRLQVRESAYVIPHSELEVDTSTESSTVALKHVAIEGYALVANVQAVGLDVAVLQLQVRVDHGPLLPCTAHKQAAGYHVHFPIAAEYFDASPHSFEIRLANHYLPLGHYVDILQPVQTPWSHLNTRADYIAQLSAVPKTAAYRYSSLQRQLKYNLAAMPHVYEAHEQLLLGPEYKRRSYSPLSLPLVTNPEVSIIIAAYENFAFTYNCVAAIILAHNHCSFEVIIIDDASSEETKAHYQAIQNANLIYNDTNLGFLKTCNKAAQEARGKYLFLLNNDTEVSSGYLDECLELFRRDPDVGIVGSKLLYPNGRLQEAGGIVWQDGKPWNLGRDANPNAPEYNYNRQVDYVSGAALMIPKQLWNEVGGFSEDYAPAYYEDTDLAFKVKTRHKKVMYCASSEVIHFEGMTNGKSTDTGIKRFQNINAPKFRKKWRHHYAHNGIASWDNVWRNQDRGISYRVLVLDYATPRPDIDAGGYAAVQEIRVLQALGFKVSFASENLAYFGSYTQQLQSQGVECLYQPFYTSIEQVIKERGQQFDLIYITRYHIAERYLGYLREHSPAKILFNNADLHFLREMRSAVKQGLNELDRVFETRDRELAVIRQADAVFCYNDIEHAVILSHGHTAENLFICPWVLAEQVDIRPFADREGLAFLGSFAHPPNREAMLFFAKTVAPLLQQRFPELKLHIYGSQMPDNLLPEDVGNIIIEGYAENLDEVYKRHRVFISPLISGAGIKGKVLNALSYGLPTVLSPLSTEGTGIAHGVHGLIAESPQDWLEAIGTLYTNEKIWNALSKNGLRLARSRYSFEHAKSEFAKVLEYLELYT